MSDYWLQTKQSNPQGYEAGNLNYDHPDTLGRYDGRKWHKAPRRDWRKVGAVPYTQGGDYSGDDITDANRREWEENVGLEGVLWARFIGSHGHREIFVRPVAARLAERNYQERERFYGLVSEETANALRTAVEYLESLDRYPALNDETYEIMWQWTQESWESYGRHDCVKEAREFVAQYWGIDSEGVETLEELEVSLNDWLYICGDAEGTGAIHCDGSEGSVTFGSADQRYAEKWLTGQCEYTHGVEGFELLCAQVFSEIEIEEELRADMTVAVMAGRLAPSEALARVTA